MPHPGRTTHFNALKQEDRLEPIPHLIAGSLSGTRPQRNEGRPAGGPVDFPPPIAKLLDSAGLSGVWTSPRAGLSRNVSLLDRKVPLSVALPMPPIHPVSSAEGAAGWWIGRPVAALTDGEAVARALGRLSRPVYVVRDDAGGLHLAHEGVAWFGAGPHAFSETRAWAAAGRSACAVNEASAATDAGIEPQPHELVALAPALPPEQLGDPAFRATHGLRYAYIAGEMANGIGSVEMVEAMGRAGMIGFFGAAGLPPAQIEAAITRIQRDLGERPYGFNLIHSPSEPALEAATAELYLKHNVTRVSASAYLDLTLPLVRYRVAGLSQQRDGTVHAANHVLAKVSRVELARKFFSPPPAELLAELVRRGEITELQARLAATLPLAEDLTAEADSGGHTDNRPLVALLPTMLALRDELQARNGYSAAPRVGAAGGIGTPHAAAAAFALGAAYVMTGSINQSCREAGTSELVKRLLTEAQQADVVMAPAADMFEMGVKVQVLKRGTMFAPRARKLYDLYRQYESLEAMPAETRAALERECFRCSVQEAWEGTCRYFAERDPSQIERGRRDARHRMALVFRSYLGQTSGWAQSGETSRQLDFQVWCGPAMGAFNEWVRGSALEQPENRDVATVGLNLLVGAAALTRANWLRMQGLALPPEAERFAPRALDALAALGQ